MTTQKLPASHQKGFRAKRSLPKVFSTNCRSASLKASAEDRGWRGQRDAYEYGNFFLDIDN